MCYKHDKQYQICHQIRFFQAQNAPKSVFGHPAGGAYDAPSDLLVSWGGGYNSPPPHSPPHSTPSASRTQRLRRLGSQAPLNTESWLRYMSMDNCCKTRITNNNKNGAQ